MELFERYETLEKLGEGTYGNVYKARDKHTNDIVAIKQINILSKEEGTPGTALREISIMLELDDPHIVKISNVFHNDDKIFMVMEYCELDLRRFIDVHEQLSGRLVKLLVLELIHATYTCHCHRVLHRDLKPENVLLKMTDESDLPICKLCDFGLARSFNVPVRAFTHEIVTLWYRAPEILLAEKNYSTAVDVWSIGCIWAELLIGRPLFKARSEIEMLFEIFEVLGTPTEETWPGVTLLPDYSEKFPRFRGRGLRSIVTEELLDDTGYEILSGMLEMDPAKRIGLNDALDSEYFKE